jgi:hypothetical protein
MLIAVARVIFNRAKQGNQRGLFAPADILIQGGIDGIFLRFVTTKFLRLFYEPVIYREIGGIAPPTYKSLHIDMCKHCRRLSNPLCGNFRWRQAGCIAAEDIVV